VTRSGRTPPGRGRHPWSHAASPWVHHTFHICWGHSELCSVCAWPSLLCCVVRMQYNSSTRHAASLATTLAQATGRHRLRLLLEYGIRSLLQVKEGHCAVQGLDAGHTHSSCLCLCTRQGGPFRRRSTQ
jgi:hypothetical protein